MNDLFPCKCSQASKAAYHNVFFYQNGALFSFLCGLGNTSLHTSLHTSLNTCVLTGTEVLYPGNKIHFVNGHLSLFFFNPLRVA